MVRQRNTGIDLLRIIAAFMVLVLHILGGGGVLESLPVYSVRYKAAWIIEIACYCAVNCFGLISGYVGLNSRFSYANILHTWFQVSFYTVFSAVILHFSFPTLLHLEQSCALFSRLPKRYTGIIPLISVCLSLSP